MANITLRSIKGSPLTTEEVDTNFSNLNIEVGNKLNTLSYNASDILLKLKTVDLDDSGLNASTLKSLDVGSANIHSTIVSRDTSGNFSASNITANLIGGVTGDVVGNVTGNLSGTASNSNSLGGTPAVNWALLASPTFTGTPSGPTAPPGTSTTQLATTAFVSAASQVQFLFPVGCVYTSTSPTNPATVFGFGTWVAFAQGRVLIGAGAGFLGGQSGGSADAVVVSHGHSASSSSYSSSSSNSSVYDPGHTHFVSSMSNGETGTAKFVNGNDGTSPSGVTVPAATTGISVSTTTSTSTSTSTSVYATGVDGTNANLQPYVVVYMWNRTA